jgi:hypothetical protein
MPNKKGKEENVSPGVTTYYAGVGLSGYVRPVSSRYNMPDTALRYVEAAGNLNLADALRVEIAYLFHFLLSQLGLAVQCTNTAAFLRNHIEHVFAVGSEEEMRRIAAASHVAPMADKQAVRDGAVRGFIGQPVYGYRALRGLAVLSNVPVTPIADNPLPQPAAVRTSTPVQPSPQALFERRPSVGYAMARKEPMGFALDVATCFTRLGRDVRGLATTAGTKLGTVKRKLNRGWYTFHVTDLLRVSSQTPAVRAARGFSMPNYSTFTT